MPPEIASFCAVVPAAGRSRRMGRPKLTLPWRDGTVLSAVLAALAAGGVEEQVVVVAPETSAGLLAGIAGLGGRRVVVNPHPELGMLSSVQAGVRARGSATDWRRRRRALVVCPGDLPGLSPQTVAAVLEAVAAGAPLALPVVDGRRGHPLVLAPGLVAEVFAADPKVGLRQVVARHGDDLAAVIVADRGAVLDLDTPEDYERATGGAPEISRTESS